MPNSTTVDVDSVAEIITNVLTQQVVVSYQSRSRNAVFNQTASGSCNNTINYNSNTTYVADTTIFTDQSTYQSTVNDIAQSVIEDIEQKAEGGIFPGGSGNKADIQTLVESIVTTTLTATQLDVNSQSDISNFQVNQVCQDSGNNAFYGSETDLVAMYSNIYSKNDATQEAATTINNMVQAKLKQTSVGAFTALIRSIAFLILFVVLLAVVIIVVLTLTYGRIVT